MSDKLEYVLMPQLVNRPEIKCLGIAYGSRGDGSSEINTLIASAEAEMVEMVRKMGGTVIIDPEVSAYSTSQYRHSVIVRCKVGVIDGEPSEPHSE
jgi:hypothetical protein